MKHLKFVIEHEPEAYPLRAATYLYNNKVYLQSKERTLGKPLTFYALQGEVAVARIHFFLTRQPNGEVEAISIPASPFGSFEYSSALSTQTLTEFVGYIKDHLLAQYADRIIIKDCIPVYREDGEYDLQEILMNSGFWMQEELVNHYIIVGHEPLSRKIHTMEMRRLKKCYTAGFTFSQEGPDSQKEVYNFIRTCRAEKEWNLSMRWDEIKQIVSLLPQHYLFFTVREQEKIVAATIAVLVNNQMLYNFYPASRMSYNPFSPAVMLISGLYQYCQQSNIKILDLGTSPTLSLQKFKEHLGGVLSYKRTYQYSV